MTLRQFQKLHIDGSQIGVMPSSKRLIGRIASRVILHSSTLRVGAAEKRASYLADRA
jgi:hypothetical protein